MCNARPGQRPNFLPACIPDRDKAEEIKQNKNALHLPGISTGRALNQNFFNPPKQLKTAFTPRSILLTASPQGNTLFSLHLIQLQAQDIEEIISITLCCCFQLIRSVFLARARVAEDDLRHQSEGPFGCRAVREPRQPGETGKVNWGFCWGGRRQTCV